MNRTIVIYTFSNIFAQSLTKLLLFLEFLVIVFIITLKINVTNDVISSINMFGKILDEPFVIRSFSITSMSMFLFIVYFLLILIAVRLFSEGYKDPFLDIVIPKLKRKTDYYYSQLAGYLVWFSLNLFLFVIITTSLISIHIGETFIVLIIIATIAFLVNVVFIGIVSSLFSLLFDGYSASLFLLLPFMFGASILAFLNSSDRTIYLFNMFFPLSRFHDFASSIFSNRLSFDINSLIVVTLLLVVAIFSATLFNRKWL